jgi:hypothetical protein
MTMIRIKLFALLAATGTALALGALGAAVAQAKTGPYFNICENVGTNNGTFADSKCSMMGGAKEWALKRLTGEKEITADVGKEFIFIQAATKLEVQCPKMHLTEHSAIRGSENRNYSLYAVTITFEGCTVKNGGGCKVVAGTIATERIYGKLAWETPNLALGEQLYVYFVPSKGARLATIKLEGKECKEKELSLEGSVAGEAWRNGAPVKLREEPVSAKVNEINFETVPTRVYLEEEAMKNRVEPKMTMGGREATLEARTDIELTSGENWGVFGNP